MEPRACADGLGLLQLQTGRPIAAQRTAHGSDNDDSSGDRQKDRSRRDYTADTPENSE